MKLPAHRIVEQHLPQKVAIPAPPSADKPAAQQYKYQVNNVKPTTNPPFGSSRSNPNTASNRKDRNPEKEHFAATVPALGSQPRDLLLGGSMQRRPSDTSRSFIAAAKLQAAAFGETDASRNITWQDGAVSRASKERLLRQRGCIIWFTGLSGSGKSTVAITLEHALAVHGRLTTLLDGDNIRHGLNSNLGFSPEDREENIRRIGEVSKLMMESGVMTLASFISPYRRDRDLVRSRMPQGDFIEVHMNVPLNVCEARDPKGLYKMARAGKIKCFTGIDDPYEAPTNPEIVLEHLQEDGTPNTPDDMAATIVDYLREQGFLQELSLMCNGT